MNISSIGVRIRVIGRYYRPEPWRGAVPGLGQAWLFDWRAFNGVKLGLRTGAVETITTVWT